MLPPTVLVLAAALIPGPQAHRLLSGSCDCTIDLEPVATVGNTTEGLYGAPVAFDQMRDGRFIVILPPSIEDVPLVVGSDGAVQGTLGRKGRGPGEYEAPIHVFVDATDSVWITDPYNARVSILSPALQFVRSIQIPPTAEAVVRTAGDHTIVHARLPTRSGAGFPLHRIDSTSVFSYGAIQPLTAPHLYHMQMRRMARARNGGVWTVPFVGHYLVERWSDDGGRLEAFERDVPWFPATEDSWELVAGRPPTPRMSGIWEDDRGVLWISTLVPDENWEDGVGETRAAEGRRFYRVADRDRLFDTILEAIDPGHGVVLASTRLDRAISLVAPAGLIADAVRNADYTYRVLVYRPVLSRM